MIDRLVAERSKGNTIIAQTTKTKLILKGINPDNFNISTSDDPVVMNRLKEIAKGDGSYSVGDDMVMETIFSQKNSSVGVVEDVIKGIRNKPSLMIYFASTKYDLELIGNGLEAAFPSTEVIGCSTAGELVTGRMLKNSVVVSALDGKLVSHMAVELVTDLGSKIGMAKAIASLENKIGCKLSSLDPNRYVGLILIDGLRGAEEMVMDTLGNLSDLTWIGGSAGDDLRFIETKVFAQGKGLTNAAVLAVLQVDGGFDIIKTQSFKPTGKKLLATEVDGKREWLSALMVSQQRRPMPMPSGSMWRGYQKFSCVILLA